MKQTIYEEIQRVKLLSSYDNSKTLSEQAKVFPPEVQIPYDFYDVAAKGPGTNPTKMLDAIKKINNPDLFWKVNDGVKKNSGGMDIAGVINDEYGFRNAQDAKNIVDHLKTIGITATYELNGSNSMKLGSFKITSAPTVTDAWSKFPCVSKHTKATASKLSDDSTAYTINNVVYYNNGRKKLADGTMGNYTCNDPEFKAKAVVKPVAIPTELKDVNGVKLFQDWLDANAKGWATGYKDGILNKGQNGGGYGAFGKRTQKAWTTYKDQYLKSATTPAAQPATPTQVAPGPDDDVK